MASLTSRAGDDVRIIPRAEHCVSRSAISKNALKVLYRLKDAGFQSFLVGGAVRDLLLGLSPKDFDIATDAHPDDVHALFRNSRLIGRRFRLAHVRFGRDIIEVATFRAATTEQDASGDVAHDGDGRILRDNVYGSISDDVWRRDFCANALYYNIADFTIWDYVEGSRDIEQRRLRLIGDPDRRLREDPVRMLRAVRFAAKLGFSIDTEIEESIETNRGLLANVPAARLFDEFLKLFQNGHAARTFALLERYNLFEQLFPDTAVELSRSDDERFRNFVQAALENSDERVNSGRSTTPMFLLGVFLWESVRALAAAKRAEKKMSIGQSLGIAAFEVVMRQQSRIAVPKRFSLPMREMLVLQPRFERTRGVRAKTLLDHPRFRAAYDFFVLRARVGDADSDAADFWTDVQTKNEAGRAEAFGVSSQSRGKRKRRGRRKPVQAGQ